MASHPNAYIFGAEGFVADFDSLYRDIEDPWEQTSVFDSSDSRRLLSINYCERLFLEGEHRRSAKVLEIGCGFGHLTEYLRVAGFNSTGVDISSVAIEKAIEKHPEASFFVRNISEVRLLEEIDPDVIILSEVTWYVLDSLDGFLSRLTQFAANRSRPTYVIHLLNTYPPGVQKYGRDFFTDENGILNYFNLDYIEAGYVTNSPTNELVCKDTFFLAKVPIE
jgi:SAM-dependent methyltransferase